MDIESINNLNNVDLGLLNQQIKEIIGADWELDARSSISKADNNGKIDCHIFVRHIHHLQELHVLPAFSIDSTLSLSVKDQLATKLKELKAIIESTNE